MLTPPVHIHPITDEERNEGLRWGVWDSAFITVTMTVVMGTFLTGLALMLGANHAQIGLLAALPSVANLAQPFGAYFVEQWGNRKRMGLVLFGSARMTWLLVLLFPWFGYTGGPWGTGLWALIAITGVASLVNAVAGISWWSWMSDLVPEAIRGRYFAQRSLIGALVGSVVAVLFGAFADRWKLHYGAGDPMGFYILFAIAVSFGMLSVWALSLIPDVPLRRSDETARWGQAVQDAVTDRNFRALTLAGAVWGFATMFSGPFYVVYMLENLHLSYGMINAFAAIASLGNVVFIGFVGRISDHFGNRPVQLACMIGAGVLPFLYLFCATGNWYAIPLANLVGGIAWAGYSIANMNQVMKVTPDENKSVYLGIYNAVTGLAFAVGPVAGGILADAIRGWHWQIGRADFIGLHIVFVVSGLGRLASIQLMRRVRERRARTVRRMLRVLWRIPSVNPMLGIASTWDAAVQVASSVRPGRRGKTADE